MKFHSLLVISGALASTVVSPPSAALWAREERTSAVSRDDVRRSVEIGRKADIEISSIRGSVRIETADISRAEIHIIRLAPDPESLKSYPVTIDGRRGLLHIRGETRVRSGSGLGPDVRHEVRLRVPRGADLRIHSISGNLDLIGAVGVLDVHSIGGGIHGGSAAGAVTISGAAGSVAIDAAGAGVRISSVSGSVRIGRLVGASDVQGVSGGVALRIAGRSPSMRIASVSGPVDLRFRETVDAELHAESIGGGIVVELPRMRTQSRGPASLHAVLGNGGAALTIRGVSGGVRLTRDSGL